MKPAGRWTLLAVAAAVVAFAALDLGRFLTLEHLRGAQQQLASLYAQHPLRFMGAFFAAYVAVTALSLPGAVPMTLAAGAVFGLGVGTLVVSFASTLGATLAMLTARHLLRDSVKRRFAARLREIDHGIARDGALYLFTLRAVPVVPFVVINLAMGLTALRVWTFVWVSQLGMLAATVVYVNAGTQLAQLTSPQDIVSGGVLGALALLGLLPWAARWAVETLRARRALAPWAHHRPRRFDRNLVVIGAGAAGLVTSYVAAAVKAKVTLVEAHRMGGDCLNTGCVPSKALIRAASAAHEARHAAGFGVEVGSVRVDFARVMARVRQSVRAIEPHDSVERYTALGVEVVQGHARIVDPWHVQITGEDGRVQTLSTRAIVVATGARPLVPPLPGLADAGVLTSDTLWDLQTLPARLVMLGGGPVGCELAQAFARLGAQVTQVEQAPRLMAREDEEVSAFVRHRLESDGVTVLTGHRALRCERLPVDGTEVWHLVVEAGGAERHIAFDRIVCAVGRQARLQGLGLEALGLVDATQPPRTLPVDEFLRTRIPTVLACGDVAGPYQFTHMAAHQARYAAVNGLFGHLHRIKVDQRVIAWCTFVDPEVARVGLNVQEARAQGVDVESTRFSLDDLDRAIVDAPAGDAGRGWLQVLTAPGRDRILGVTIVGRHAGELLAEFVLAMTHGIGLNKILGTLHVYPTLSEAAKQAAGQWKRAHAPLRLLRWVQQFHGWRRG